MHDDLIDFPVSWDWHRHYSRYDHGVDPGPAAPELVIRFDVDGTVHCSDDKARRWLQQAAAPRQQTARPFQQRQVATPAHAEQPKYRRSIDGIVKNQPSPKPASPKTRPSPIVDLGIAE